MTETRSTPSTANDAADIGGRIIDVNRGSDVTSWFRYAIGISLTCAVVAGLVFTAIEFGFGKRPIIVGIVIASIVGLAAFFVFGFMNNNSWQRGAWDEDLPDDELARKIMDGMARPGLAWLVEGVMKTLPARGRVGFVVRCCPERLRTTVEPISVRFEPLALNEADVATAAFAESQQSGDGTPTGLLFSPDADFEPAPGRRVRRIARLAGPLRLIFGGLSIAGCVAIWVSSGDVPWLVLFSIIFILVSPFLYGAGSTGENWFLVPGGLVVRAWGRRAKHSVIQLYKRSQSLLIVTRLAKGNWSVAVGNGNTCRFCNVTDAEVNLLLRCWLSPLKPPPVERYSDLRASG